MGITNNLVDSPGSDHNVEKASQEPDQAHADIVKPPNRRRRLVSLFANSFRSPSEKADQAGKRASSEGDDVKGQEYVRAGQVKEGELVAPPGIDNVLEVEAPVLDELRGALERSRVSADASFAVTKELQDTLAAYAAEKVQQYDSLRQQGTLHEFSLGFDFSCTKNARPIEIQANEVLQHLKKNDIARIYQTAPKKRGYRGQEHPRFYGDHFLSNLNLIEQTQLFALCRAMPKDAHLHIHFNSNLRFSVLLGIAKDMERMFIWSNIPLDRDEAFDLCRIQFSIMNEAAVAEKGAGNPFESTYEAGRVMQFQRFREAFPEAPDAADSWLQSRSGTGEVGFIETFQPKATS